jgi:hypothetical protein
MLLAKILKLFGAQEYKLFIYIPAVFYPKITYGILLKEPVPECFAHWGKGWDAS